MPTNLPVDRHNLVVWQRCCELCGKALCVDRCPRHGTGVLGLALNGSGLGVVFLVPTGCGVSCLLLGESAVGSTKRGESAVSSTTSGLGDGEYVQSLSPFAFLFLFSLEFGLLLLLRTLR